MTQKIVTECDFHRTDTETTCLIASKKYKDGHFWILKGGCIFIRLKNPDYGKKVRAFYLKWHPNFLHR